MLALKNELGSVPSSSVFWKRLCRINGGGFLKKHLVGFVRDLEISFSGFTMDLFSLVGVGLFKLFRLG